MIKEQVSFLIEGWLKKAHCSKQKKFFVMRKREVQRKNLPDHALPLDSEQWRVEVRAGRWILFHIQVLTQSQSGDYSMVTPH